MDVESNVEHESGLKVSIVGCHNGQGGRRDSRLDIIGRKSKKLQCSTDKISAVTVGIYPSTLLNVQVEIIGYVPKTRVIKLPVAGFKRMESL